MEIRLLIACTRADDAAHVARALHAHALEAPTIEAHAIAIEHACTIASSARFDVALLDHDPGLRMLPSFAHASPGTRSLLLYDVFSSGEVVEAIRLGAFGRIARSTDPQLMAKAVRTVHAGDTWYERSALLQAVRGQIGMNAVTVATYGVSHREEARAASGNGMLTHREEEILQLIGEGLSNKEIARRLCISDHTVKTHLHRVYSKLQQSRRFKAFLAQPQLRAI